MNNYFYYLFTNKNFINSFKKSLKKQSSQQLCNKIIKIYNNNEPYKKEKYVTRNIKS